jgi:type VI secretion system protein ImpF
MSGDGLSVLDRLTTEATRARPGAGDLRDSLRRDLEWLLNSRRRVGLPPGVRELDRSVVGYGLPDLSRFYPHSATDRDALQEAIAQAVEAFEPRLRSPRVVLEPPDGTEPGLRFRIEGELAQPAAGWVGFSGRLHLGSGEFRLNEGER